MINNNTTANKSTGLTIGKKKPLNNDQALKKLIREVDGTIYSALLRERILHIIDLTEESIKQEPDKWKSLFVHPDLYTKLAQIVRDSIGFGE